MAIKGINNIYRVYSKDQTKDLMLEIKELREQIQKAAKDLTEVKKPSNAVSSPYLPDRPDFDPNVQRGSLNEASWKEVLTDHDEARQKAYNHFYKKKLNVL